MRYPLYLDDCELLAAKQLSGEIEGVDHIIASPILPVICSDDCTIENIPLDNEPMFTDENIGDMLPIGLRASLWTEGLL